MRSACRTRGRRPGSYTFSRVDGLQASSGTTAEGAQLSTVASSQHRSAAIPTTSRTRTGGCPTIARTFSGINGVVHVPRIGVLRFGNLQHFSGKPWATTTQYRFLKGISVPARRSADLTRLSSQSYSRFSRVEDAVGFGDATRVELLLDVLNLLNDTAEEALVSDVLVSATFERARSFVDPRRAMFGVRLHLGR